MASRVVIGALPGGGYGLKSSLPGFDVLSVTNDDSQKLSFSSNWTNVAHVHMTGVGSIGAGISNMTISYVSLGYIPFVEVRSCNLSSGVVYDDMNVLIPIGSGSGDAGGRVTAMHANPISYSSAFIINRGPAPHALYVIYKLQAFS